MTTTFFVLNSDWIKNIIIAVCTIIGAVIAILTYNRAKVSILQSEVAKQQTGKLNELLCLFTGYKEIFLIDLYYEILVCNLYEYAKIYGHEFHLSSINSSKSDEGDLELDKLRDGWLILDMSIERFFSDIHENMEPKASHPAKGFKRVDVLYITNSYHEFAVSMRKYAEDPFLPKFVCKKVTEILKQVDSNLRGPLAHVFDINLDNMLSCESTQPIWPQAIFNQFNQISIHHEKTIVRLINRLRRYLRI